MVSQQVQTIAAASKHQSATADDIKQSIVGANEAAAETAAAMRQATDAVSELAGQAVMLRDVIAQLRQGETPA